MVKNDFEDLDAYEKSEKTGEKTLEIVSSIGVSMAASALISVLFGIEDVPIYLGTITGGTALTSPFVYFGLRKLKNKMDERFTRDMHHAGQIGVMFKDAMEKDRRIGSMTSLFLNEIIEIFTMDNPDYPQDEMMSINQFLYLINSNYYERIPTRMQGLNREELIRRVIQQISFYLNKSNKQTFDELDAEKVLETCIFIPSDLKQEIALEFKKSKVKMGQRINYEIIRNDTHGGMTEYMLKKETETKGQITNFDIDSISDYQALIEAYTNSKKFLELEIGDPQGLIWNVEFLRTIITTIARKHRRELLNLDDNFSNFKLAGSFIYNAMSYAVVNKREEVGSTEMLNTFKNWNYLPFDLRLAVLDEVFESGQIDYDKHPFNVSKHQKSKSFRKIIPFNPKLPTKSE